MRFARGLCLLALAVLVASSIAQEARAATPKAAVREARVSYEQGREAYQRGDFEAAIAAFSRAHALDPAPMLLFNLAQAYWKTGDYPSALRSYRAYLAAAPGAENRPQVDRRIAEIEQQIEAAGGKTAPAKTAAAGALPPAAMSPVQPAQPPGPMIAATVTEAKPAAVPEHRQRWVWLAIGGALFAGAAAGFLLTARRQDPWMCSSCDLSTQRVP